MEAISINKTTQMIHSEKLYVHQGPKHEMSIITNLALLVRWISTQFGIQQPTVVDWAVVSFCFWGNAMKVNHIWESMCNVFASGIWISYLRGGAKPYLCNVNFLILNHIFLKHYDLNSFEICYITIYELSYLLNFSLSILYKQILIIFLLKDLIFFIFLTEKYLILSWLCVKHEKN
jgi:hypothetical protein